MDVWDVRLAAGKSARFPIASGRNSMLVALRGTLLVNGESVARDAQLALFSRDGEDITVEANNDAVFRCCRASRSTSLWWVTARS